ncbi:MAG: Arylsulfatase [Verrucomicrobia subdivision 3 bacterium]|nr:Arylsulfatase [Limisphaerales bacterium]MCS1416150.1 Arylsulfatase [Limisphaerales bacterium]
MNLKGSGVLPILLAGICVFVAERKSILASQYLPNVRVIIVDDMGYGDLGCYGNEMITAPPLGRLVSESLRFTDFCASGAWCVPGHKGLMSGVHSCRGD